MRALLSKSPTMKALRRHIKKTNHTLEGMSDVDKTSIEAYQVGRGRMENSNILFFYHP